MCVCVEWISLLVLCANRFYFEGGLALKVDWHICSLSTGLESLVSLIPRFTDPSMTSNPWPLLIFCCRGPVFCYDSKVQSGCPFKTAVVSCGTEASLQGALGLCAHPETELVKRPQCLYGHPGWRRQPLCDLWPSVEIFLLWDTVIEVYKENCGVNPKPIGPVLSLSFLTFTCWFIFHLFNVQSKCLEWYVIIIFWFQHMYNLASVFTNVLRLCWLHNICNVKYWPKS